VIQLAPIEEMIWQRYQAMLRILRYTVMEGLKPNVHTPQ